MNNKDREILRGLAHEQMKLATSQKMDNLVKEWYQHNDLQGKRPMIIFDGRGISKEIITPMLQCESAEARAIEFQLFMNFINHKHYGDDRVVDDHFSVIYNHTFKPFDIDEKVIRTDGIGHHYVSQIEDLEDDFHKLKPSTFTMESNENAMKRVDILNELFGDILPVRLKGQCATACLTQNIVHLMSMEDLYFSVLDYPDLFKEMMENLSNDYIRYFTKLEEENLFLPTNTSEYVGQGMYCFTKDLPSMEQTKMQNIWLFMDAQETVGISPAMYEEFIFPYYKKISQHFGLFSYGCCEPVHGIWDSCLSKLENLRKVSISAWCDEAIMAEKLKSANVIYARKPSANHLAVNRYLDEDAAREHIRNTVNVAKDCHLEFIQRDVPTIHGDISKLARYIEIIREECK